jgi:pyruvyltransferase
VADTLAVELFHWNPTRPRIRGRVGRYLPFTAPVDNFGDLLGPVVVQEIVERQGLVAAADQPDRRLFSIGSVMHFARTGDTVWGTGVNGKIAQDKHLFEDLDVRAVRGPLTRSFLSERGIRVPAVFGDPGLLVGRLWEREQLARGFERRSHSIVPNFHDYPSQRREPNTVNPRDPIWDVIGQIAASDFVVGSSLHGVIVAESLGIPARLVRSGTETAFKYEDYYLGSGRGGHTPGESAAEALSLGGEPPIDWDPEPLLASFPADLWR